MAGSALALREEMRDAMRDEARDAAGGREAGRRRRARNLAVGGALLALAILFYLITIVRMGGA